MRGPGEGVDHLVRITDHAQVVTVAQPDVEQQLLQRVDVLVLVDHEGAERGANLIGRRAAVGQDRRRQLQHGFEVDQLALPAQPFVGVVQRRHPVGTDGPGGAAGLGRGGHVLVGPHLRHLGPLDLRRDIGQAAAFGPQPQHPGGVAEQRELGFDQPGRAAAHHPGPEVRELPQCRSVEGRRADRFGAQARAAEQAQPATQFTRGPHGEREREHPRGIDHPGQRRVGDAVGDRPGLARPGSRQHAHRPAHGQGDRTLLRVQRVQYRAGSGLAAVRLHCCRPPPLLPSPRSFSRPRRPCRSAPGASL